MVNLEEATTRAYPLWLRISSDHQPCSWLTSGLPQAYVLRHLPVQWECMVVCSSFQHMECMLAGMGSSVRPMDAIK